MDITQTIALTMGVAWASGINLYAAILMLGYLGTTGNIDLPPDLQILTDPMVMLAAGLMYCVEFFTDKIPGVDTGWDLRSETLALKNDAHRFDFATQSSALYIGLGAAIALCFLTRRSVYLELGGFDDQSYH